MEDKLKHQERDRSIERHSELPEDRLDLGRHTKTPGDKQKHLKTYRTIRRQTEASAGKLGKRDAQRTQNHQETDRSIGRRTEPLRDRQKLRETYRTTKRQSRKSGEIQKH